MLGVRSRKSRVCVREIPGMVLEQGQCECVTKDSHDSAVLMTQAYQFPTPHPFLRDGCGEGCMRTAVDLLQAATYAMSAVRLSPYEMRGNPDRSMKPGFFACPWGGRAVSSFLLSQNVRSPQLQPLTQFPSNPGGFLSWIPGPFTAHPQGDWRFGSLEGTAGAQRFRQTRDSVAPILQIPTSGSCVVWMGTLPLQRLHLLLPLLQRALLPKPFCI